MNEQPQLWSETVKVDESKILTTPLNPFKDFVDQMFRQRYLNYPVHKDLKWLWCIRSTHHSDLSSHIRAFKMLSMSKLEERVLLDPIPTSSSETLPFSLDDQKRLPPGWSLRDTTCALSCRLREPQLSHKKIVAGLIERHTSSRYASWPQGDQSETRFDGGV